MDPARDRPHAADSCLTRMPGEAPNYEAELAQLLRETSAPGCFFVRCNFEPPKIDVRTWRLRIGGAVERSAELGLADLRRRETRTIRTTLECAGNGRTRVEPVAPGTPWTLGAVSTARFTGTPLAPLLEEAGVSPRAVEVAFRGADAGEVEPGREIHFERSLPIGVARSPSANVLLVWEMDGEPLSRKHGFPLRLLVPGWYGVASVKWLSAIEVLEAPFRGHFQVERYVYRDEGGTPPETPVRTMRVRSLVATPASGARLGPPGRPISVAGAAWSGEGGAARVEVSTDGGATWADAEWRDPPDRYAARRWRFAWTPPTAGRYTLVSRATDAAGRRQPAAGRWNALGYGNNGLQTVTVWVDEDPS